MQGNGDDDDDWRKLNYSIPVNWILREDGTRAQLIYTPPNWTSLEKVESGLTLDVIMKGQLLSNISLSDKPYYIIGSIPNSDVCYPSVQVSRKHVVLQYHRDKRLLVMDLDSKCGTILNGKKLEPLSYYPYNIGDQLILGAPDINRRIFVLNGPNELSIQPEVQSKDISMKNRKKLKAEFSVVDNKYYDDVFDEDDEFFDRTNVDKSKKKRRKKHNIESLKQDIARLGEQEMNVINRWHKLLRAQYNPNEAITDELALDLKIELEQDKIMLQQELDAYRVEMSRFSKLLEIATL